MINSRTSTFVNSVFEQPWWLDAVAPNAWRELTVKEEGVIIARWPIVEIKNIIGMPKLTQTLGFWLSEDQLDNDTFYNKMTIDKKLPQGNLSLEMPNNAFNIREIHLYNGECCGPSTSQVVHWKRTFNNKGGGDGYTARIKDLGGKGDYDAFLPDHFNYDSTYEFSGTKYYANVQNGVIMFSTDCRAYTNVRITYNGLVGSVGSIPVIPRFFEISAISSNRFSSKNCFSGS